LHTISQKSEEIKNMKTIIIICSVWALTQVEGRSVDTDTSPNTFTPLQEECLNELELTDQKQAIASLNNRAICPEDNPNYNKFISCFWKKTGRQNENGEVNYETIRLFVRAGIIRALGDDAAATTFAEENSTKIVNECKSVSGSTPEETVVKVRNCIVRGINNAGPK